MIRVALALILVATLVGSIQSAPVAIERSPS